MIFVDLKQQQLAGAKIDPLLQRVQELISIGPQDVVRLVVPLLQVIVPIVVRSYLGRDCLRNLPPKWRIWAK